MISAALLGRCPTSNLTFNCSSDGPFGGLYRRATALLRRLLVSDPLFGSRIWSGMLLKGRSEAARAIAVDSIDVLLTHCVPRGLFAVDPERIAALLPARKHPQCSRCGRPMLTRGGAPFCWHVGVGRATRIYLSRAAAAPSAQAASVS